MKSCTVWGDLSSDKSSENYPEETVCDECVKSNQKKEDSPIVSVNGEFSEGYDAECYLCGKLKSEE